MEENKASIPEKENQTEILINKLKADGYLYEGCPKNDYCQHFVDSGYRAQNFIRFTKKIEGVLIILNLMT